MDLEEAIEVFVRGFSLTKSQTHPYVAERFGNLWVMRDAPGRKEPRKIEVIAHGVSPAEAVTQVKEGGLGWHFLCHIQKDEESTAETKTQYKALGYRALSTEWMFHHRLQNIPEFRSAPAVQIVATQAEADAIPQVAKHKIRLLPGSTQFGVWDTDGDIGWVRNIPAGRAVWVSNLFVRAEHRGYGYGRALMSSLLLDTRDSGLEASVLLASTAGARLYPHLGYEQIGILQMFCPAIRS